MRKYLYLYLYLYCLLGAYKRVCTDQNLLLLYTQAHSRARPRDHGCEVHVDFDIYVTRNIVVTCDIISFP